MRTIMRIGFVDCVIGNDEGFFLIVKNISFFVRGNFWHVENCFQGELKERNVGHFKCDYPQSVLLNVPLRMNR